LININKLRHAKANNISINGLYLWSINALCLLLQLRSHTTSFLLSWVRKPLKILLSFFIEEKIKSEVQTKASTLATKEDVARTGTKIETAKAELIKWMFVFWVGQVITTFGFILLFMKK
jgi:hypothetical protein